MQSCSGGVVLSSNTQVDSGDEMQHDANESDDESQIGEYLSGDDEDEIMDKIDLSSEV